MLDKIVGAAGVAAEKIKNVTASVLAERERRLSTPEFQREMAAEKSRCAQSLKNTAGHTFNAASSLVMNGALRPFGNALRMVSEKNYGAGDVLWDTTKNFGTAAWDCTKFLASATLTTGRLGKLAARYLIAR